jgi:hypothetical protein
MFSLSSSLAQTPTTVWTNSSGDGQWSNPLNWTAGVPTASVVANFSSSSPGTVIVPSGATARQVTVSSQYQFTGGTIATPRVFCNTAYSITFQTAFAQFPGDPTQYFHGGTIQGGISGAQDLTLDDGMILTGSMTYSGATTIAPLGSIKLTGGGAILNSSAVNIGGQLSLQYTAGSVDRIAESIPIHLQEHGAFSLANTGSQVANEKLGVLHLDAGYSPLNVNGMVLIVESLNRRDHVTGYIGFGPGGSVGMINAPTWIGGGGGVGTVNRSIVPWLSGKTSGVLPVFVTIDGGFARTLNVEEMATTLTGVPATANVRITDAQTLSDDTTVNSLVVNNAAGVISMAGKTLDVTSGGILVGNPTSFVNLTPFVGGGQLRSPGELIITGVGSTNLSQCTIDSSIVADSLTVSGRASLVLTRVGTIGGEVTICGNSTVSSKVQGSLGTGTVVLDGGGITVEGQPQSIGSPLSGVRIVGSGNVSSSSGLTVTIPGPLTGSGALGSAGTLLLLADSPSFTGSVRSVSALRVDGILGSPSSPVNIGAIADTTPGTLTGRAANIFGRIAGKDIEPGLPIGVMRAQTLVGDILDYRYALGIDIAGAGDVAGVDFDQLILSQSVSLLNRYLDIRLLDGFTPDIGKSFLILRNDGALPIDGTFIGLPQGTRFFKGNTQFQIDYFGGNGNDVVLGVVPEPGAAMLCLGAIAIACGLRRH